MEVAELTPEVASVVTGAPEFRVERELLDAAYDFCRRTGIWQQELDPVTPKDGWAEYEFVVPFRARAEKVLWGYHGTSRMAAWTESDVRAANHRAEDNTGDPRHYAMMRGGRNKFVVHPIPANADKDFVFYALLVPTRDAEEIPDFLADEWQDALVAGAVARLFKADAAWANPGASQEYRRDFQREIARAKREAMTGYGAQGQVKPQRFGA